MHHLSVLMVNLLEEVPFCFICGEPGEKMTVWYTDDSETEVGITRYYVFCKLDSCKSLSDHMLK